MKSVNGWPVLEYGSSKIHRWKIPAKNGWFEIPLRNGSAGFLIAHFLLWFSEVIEDMTGGIMDDWGHAVRPVRGQTSGYSNHASGTAADMNATKHPIGVRWTFRAWQYAKMRARILIYRGCLRLGIDYQNRPDEMHVEINKPIENVERRARRLMTTKRGQRILDANPGQKRVILS